MEHEKLFDEISTKLQELSHHSEVQSPMRADQLQTQLRQFQSDLLETQSEFRLKIKNLESMATGSTDSQQKLKVLTEQLQQERNLNTKLNSDLAGSLEMNLKLQLEIQEVRARFMQWQVSEKKHTQSLQEKIKSLQQDLELQEALKDETMIEFEKAKSLWQSEQEGFSASLVEIQESAKQQSDQMNDYVTAAEAKIADLKNILDKKSIESQDYYNHLQQALTQLQIFQQENLQLKSYIQKMNSFFEQRANSTLQGNS